jgi:hypothetical protein
MSLSNDTTIALNVRLKPSDSSAHPRAANYTNVGIAQGIAYVDFGFIEPALLAAIAKTAKDGQPAPKGLDGHLVTRLRRKPRLLSRGGCATARCRRRLNREQGCHTAELHPRRDGHRRPGALTSTNSASLSRPAGYTATRGEGIGLKLTWERMATCGIHMDCECFSS